MRDPCDNFVTESLPSCKGSPFGRDSAAVVEIVAEHFDVIDPSTEQPFASAPDCSLEQLDHAFRAADDAFHRSWSTDEAERCRLLLVAAGRLRERPLYAARLTYEALRAGTPARRVARDLEALARRVLGSNG